jgi:hypothetical protein
MHAASKVTENLMATSISPAQLFPVAAIFAIIIGGCTDRPNPAGESKAMSRDTAGMTASIAASLEVDAKRACMIAGIDDISVCAQQDGVLLSEKQAQAVAKFAVEQRKSYNKECRESFDAAYCDDLLSRAIDMEWRKPVETSAPPKLDPR